MAVRWTVALGLRLLLELAPPMATDGQERAIVAIYGVADLPGTRDLRCL